MRNMWIILFFDLPVANKELIKEANKFKKFLIKDGYVMIQWSVYVRFCIGTDRLEKHIRKVKNNAPKNGSIRILEVTDKQYERMHILIGKRKIEEENHPKNLLLF